MDFWQSLVPATQVDYEDEGGSGEMATVADSMEVDLSPTLQVPPPQGPPLRLGDRASYAGGVRAVESAGAECCRGGVRPVEATGAWCCTG